jgi:hypothetical protein
MAGDQIHAFHDNPVFFDQFPLNSAPLALFFACYYQHGVAGVDAH